MSMQKRAEEKINKEIKEQQKLEHNKFCAECDKQGVAYVDVITYTFICATCAGAIRDYHRTKSLTAATFTQDDVTQLKANGNKRAKSIWMAKFNPSVQRLPDRNNPVELKDFMRRKYQEKKWYDATAAVDVVEESIQDGDHHQKSRGAGSLSNTATADSISDAASVLSFQSAATAGNTAAVGRRDNSSRLTTQKSGVSLEQQLDAFADNTSKPLPSVSDSAPKATSQSKHLQTPQVTSSNQKSMQKTPSAADDLLGLNSLDFTTGSVPQNQFFSSGMGQTSNNFAPQAMNTSYQSNPFQMNGGMAQQQQQMNPFGNSQSFGSMPQQQSPMLQNSFNNQQGPQQSQFNANPFGIADNPFGIVSPPQQSQGFQSMGGNMAMNNNVYAQPQMNVNLMNNPFGMQQQPYQNQQNMAASQDQNPFMWQQNVSAGYVNNAQIPRQNPYQTPNNMAQFNPQPQVVVGSWQSSQQSQNPFQAVQNDPFASMYSGFQNGAGQK
ncbi:hypothetical protein MP228_008327 [Amoeboaphelidium protococcarum]|nr:hypothetical protein MP228_008327 [Amoeboaphelidium protococcarum]